MRGRRLALAALLWVATVAGASTLTWVVISSVGARVGQPVVVTTPDETPSAAPGQAVTSWSGKVGKITAACTGDAIRLETAVPSLGYRVEVYEHGPERLHVEFEANEAEDEEGEGKEVRILASCVDGSPAFTRA